MFPHHPRGKGSQFLSRLTDGLESSDFLSILTQLGFSGLMLHNCFSETDLEEGHEMNNGSSSPSKHHLNSSLEQSYHHHHHSNNRLTNGGLSRDHDLKIARLCVCLISEVLAVWTRLIKLICNASILDKRPYHDVYIIFSFLQYGSKKKLRGPPSLNKNKKRKRLALLIDEQRIEHERWWCDEYLFFYLFVFIGR